jgi:drug/metabolite transporter (DMT)-like permease
MSILLKQKTFNEFMTLFGKLALQAVIFGVVGGLIGYFLGTGLPRGTTAELIQSLGNISAIAGSLLGWSVGWLSQSRSLIKEIDYHSARQLFRQLGDIQRELIWRWGIVFSCSIIVIIGSVVMKMTSLSEDGFHWTMTAAVGFLGVALGFIAYLFERMLALSALKSELDDFEHDELHKQRLLGHTNSDE